MSNFENLNFQVSVSGTHWGKLPQFSIWLDDELQHQGSADTATEVYEFSKTLEEGVHELKIRLENKTQSDTVLAEDGTVTKDMLLNIDDITIDDISLDNLLWQAEYILDKPQTYQGQTVDHLDGCVNLGWNGSYVLKFSSPFYIWLLERL